MFEFGRDLRKLFAQARESEDLGWVELIGVDLLAAEARREAMELGFFDALEACVREAAARVAATSHVWRCRRSLCLKMENFRSAGGCECTL